MNKIILACVLVAAACTGAFAQNDAKSKNILAQLSKNYKSYKTITADVAFTINNRQENIKEEQKGKVYLKGNKFRIEMGGQLILSDGKDIWTFLKDLNEVNISTFEPGADELSPTNIFTIYEKGFQSYYIGEAENGAVKLHTIDLVPTDKEKSFFKIRINVDQKKNQIVDATIFDKNGTLYTYAIKNFVPNSVIPDTNFVFDTKKYPDVEVVDLR